MTRWLAVLLAGSLAAAIPQWVGAQQAPSTEISGPAESNDARAMLTRMTDFLAKAQSFSVTMDSAYDAVQASGQKIEFGSVRQIVLSRPDKLRIDLQWRDGSRQMVLFDGKTLTMYSPAEKVFASLAKPGTVDQVLYYMVNELKTPIPLSLLLVTTVGQELEKRITEIAVVDDEALGGRAVEHIAARTDEIDFQVWIAQGDEPVPLRVVITYKKAPGQPQFTATLSDWTFNTAVDPSAFEFEPPADASSVAFMVPVPEPARRNGTRK